MSACSTNIKGLNVVVHYTFFEADHETGLGYDIDLNAVFVLGSDQIVDDSDDKNILDVLGFTEVAILRTACRADAIKTMRLGEEA
jgi:hypothetical protein